MRWQVPGGSAHWTCNRPTPRYRRTRKTNTRLPSPRHLACTNTDEWHSDCVTHPPPSSDSCRQLSARKCSAFYSATWMMSSSSHPLSLNSSKDWTRCSRDWQNTGWNWNGRNARSFSLKYNISDRESRSCTTLAKQLRSFMGFASYIWGYYQSCQQLSKDGLPRNFEIKYRPEKHNANANALSRLTPAAMVSSDVDSCFEELTRTTKLPAEIRVNAVEAREQAPAIMSDSIGTVPSISPADTRELQKSDDVLQHIIWYRNRGRHPDIRERSDESKAALALLAMGQRIVEHDGVLYRHVTTPGGSHFCHLAWSLQHCAACMTEQGTRGALLTWRRSYTPTMSPRMAKLAIHHTIWCSAETAGYPSTCYWGERSRPVMVGSSNISVGCMMRMRKQRHSWTTTPTSERRVMIATNASFHSPPGSACISASTPNAPLLWTVRDQVDREETSSSSPVSDCSSTSGDEEENIRPVTLRRTCRTRAGTHTNPGNWPRSANR